MPCDRRSRRRWFGVVGAVGVLALVTASCQWMFGGFLADGTRYNPIESNLGVTEVSTLLEAWTGRTGGSVSSAAWADGRVFVTSGDAKLYVFSGNGTGGCGGTPKTCAPLWTASLPSGRLSNPAVVAGRVYVDSGGTLLVFDAAGATNCSGAPKVCEPLWSAAGADTDSPVVDSGRVYVSANQTLSVFDAAGVTGCGGTPRTCAPLWTFTIGCDILCRPLGSPSVAGGVVYIGSSEGDERGGNGLVYALSAAGTTGCGGVPRVCTPLWGTHVGQVQSSPAVAGGTVYVTSSTVDIVFMTGTHYLNALDAATGALRWRVETDDWTSTPAIAYDRVFLAESDGFRVFDTAGNFIRHGTLQTNTHASPFVSDGVLYLTGTGELAAFDAVGDQGCPAPAGPCTPIWTSPPGLSSLSSPIENVGTVYAGGDDDALHAFTPS